MTRRKPRALVGLMSTVLLALTLTGCGGDADTRTETAGLENGETIDLTDGTFDSTEVRGHELGR